MLIRRRYIAIGLSIVVLVTAGCSASKDTADGVPVTAEQRQVAQLRALPFGELNIAVATGVLTSAGTGIHDDLTTVAQEKPVRFIRWQVQNLAAEAANGGGLTGEALSALAPVKPGAPPMPYLVAAWAKAYDSPSARFARELMGNPDWSRASELTYPNMALALFLADALAGSKPSPEPATKATAQSMRLAGMSSDGVCAFAANFIQSGVIQIAQLLKVSTDGGGFFGFLGKIWNIAVDLAASAVQGLVQRFAKPVVDLVTDAFGVVALIQQFSSFLDKWRTTLSPQPSHTRFGVDSEVITGQVELAVAQKTLQVPDVIAKCASAFQVDLRDAASAAGSKITWSDKNTGPVQPLATRTSADAALAQDKTARYRYQTAQESSELAKSPDTETYAYRVSGVIHRNDVEKALELFKHLGLAHLPAEVRGIAEAITSNLLAKPKQHLTQLTDVTVSEPPVYITYHVRRTTPSPSKPDTGTVNGKKATIPHTGYCGGHTFASLGYREPEMRVTADGWVCFFIRNPSENQLVISVVNYPLTAPVVPDAQPVAIPGATAAWIDDNCTTQTGPCYSVDAVVGNQTLQISGAASRDDAMTIVKSILGVA